MRTWWFRFLALLLAAEILLPIVYWKAGLPSTLDFAKEPLTALIIAFTLAYMIRHDHIPAMVLIILGLTLVWATLALAYGQTIGATAWGWWRIFKYPLLTLFAYLIPDWPKDFSRWFIKFLVIMLAFQVVVQLGQFATGERIGDSLAGTFGRQGVGNYSMLLFFTVCIGMGYWSSTGNLKILLAIIGLGLVGSTLNETKFYLVAVPIMGVGALVLHLLLGQRFRQLFIFTFLITLAVVGFFAGYNRVVVPLTGARPLSDFSNSDFLEWYIFQDETDRGIERQIRDYGRYGFRRGSGVIYAWERISTDPMDMLFGFGLGSREDSSTLGVIGHDLAEDLYGIAGMKDLPKFMLQFGILGLAVFFLIAIWIIIKLFRHMKRTPDKHLVAVEFGMILFTAFWPLWLFYHGVWLHGGVMSIYWLTLGYVFQQIYQRPNPRRIAKANSSLKALQSGD